MFALVDCNSFYASCQQIFRPDLRGKPVVVLSNNDGFVVARSREARLAVARLYRPGKRYLKAGVGLIELVDRNHYQDDLFYPEQSRKKDQPANAGGLCHKS